MWWNDGYFFGMNLLWWCFWLLLIVSFFALLTPVPRSRYRELSDEPPLEILKRRLAKGEITLAEYEERRTVLLRDELQPSKRESTSSAPPMQTNKPREA